MLPRHHPWPVGWAFLLFWRLAAFGQPSADAVSVTITTVDEARRVIPGVRVQLQIGQNIVASAETDQQGLATFTELRPAHYNVTASKERYELLRKDDLDLSKAAVTSVELTMVPTLARRDSVDVQGAATPLERSSP